MGLALWIASVTGRIRLDDEIKMHTILKNPISPGPERIEKVFVVHMVCNSRDQAHQVVLD